MGKRPVSVLIVAVVYLVVGVIGFGYHFPELTAGHRDAIAIELTELTAVIAGVALLMRKNWLGGWRWRGWSFTWSSASSTPCKNSWCTRRFAF